MLDLEQQIFKQLEAAKRPLIVFPANGNGDAVASALAFFLFLQGLGKEVDIVGLQEEKNVNSPSNLIFLPSYSQIQNNINNLRRFVVSVDISEAKVNQIKYTVENNQLNFIISPSEGWFKPEDVSARAGEFKYDLIITLGVPDLESLGKVYDQNIEFFYKTTVINIDQQSANENFGQINFIDLNAVAIAELLFYLLKNYKNELITADVATCILAGIITKTKNFKTANLTPRTLLTTSELISLGARREEIVTHLYRSRDLSSLKLWGRVLNNLREEQGGQLIWSTLKLDDFKEIKAADDSLDEIVDELIANVPNAKIIVILKEDGPAKTKLIIYSLKNINALELIKDYSPLGSAKLAQAEIAFDIDTAGLEVINNLKNKLDKLNA